MTAAELKASILDLAVRGRLVPQDPKDKPAAKPSDIDDPPYELPRNWVWKRLGEICESIQYGYNAPAKERGRIRLVRISDIQDNQVLWENVPYCDIVEEEIEKYTLENGDVLFARTGGTVGKSFLVKEVPVEAIYAGYLIRARFKKGYDSKYIKHFMESPLYWQQLKNGTIATAQPNCNGKTLANMMLPLPPLPEQKRIVAKIEELLPLVEEYGEAQKELEALNVDFPAALRESILQDAVQGKLAAEWRRARSEKFERFEKFETAQDLLDRIAAEKKRLLTAKKIKKEKSLPPITDDEKPFEIPDTWAWCRLCNIIQSVGGRENQVLAKSVSPNGKFPVVSQGQSLVDGFSDDESKVVFDVPVIMFGDHTRNVKYVDFPFVIGADGTKFFKTASYPRWLYYWTVFQASQIGARGYGRHWGLLNEVLVALPPLAEQKAIVERVDELLKIVDAMKAQ